MNEIRFIDPLIANCELIRRFCSENRSETNDQFGADCERMCGSAQFISRIAAEFFLDSVHDNGFMTFVRLSSIYTNKIAKQIQTRHKIHPHYVKLIKLILIYADWLTDLYGDLKKEQKNGASSNGQLIVKTTSGLMCKRLYEGVNFYDDVFPLKFSTCFCYWLPDDVRRGLKLVYLSMAAGKNLPWSLSSLFSSRYYDKYILETYKNANLSYPFAIWHLSEHPLIVNTVNYFVNFGLPVKSETLYLPKQSRFRLDYRSNILDFDRMSEQEKDAYFNDEVEQEWQRSPGLRHRNHETIRCRYSHITSREKILESRERIRKSTKFTPKVLKYHTVRRPAEESDENSNYCRTGSENGFVNSNDSKDFDPNPDGKLVLYIHGGAFFTMGAKSYEMFLRKIVNELGGCNILAIDYSLTVPHPTALQEILDVYLWLLSGQEEVKQMLRFHPNEIILAGDSAGGYFATTLTIVLNELNKMLAKSSEANGLANSRSKSQSIRLPSSIVSVFGILSFSNLSPSMILPILDPLVETHLLLVVISLLGANVWCQGDFKRIESGEQYQRIVAKNKDKFVTENASIDFPQDDRTPWFRCDYGTYMNRAEYIDSFFDHPFINPLLYQDQLDELKSVDLYCCVGNDDCALDSSIELARIWKGKTCLTVFEDVTHAYTQLSSVSAEATDAFAITVQRLQEAVGLSKADCSV